MRKNWLRVGALTLTLVIVFPLALIAANWQWHRHFERQALNLELENSINSQPTKITNLDQIEPNYPEYKTFSLSGSFTNRVSWWRKQSLDGVPGFIALNDFQLANGEHLVVAVGWSQTVQTFKAINFTKIEGRLRYIHDFSIDPDDLPLGQTNTPASLLSAEDKIYIELVNPQIEGLATIPLPEITAGPHLGYVGQWILISIFAIAVYIVALKNLPKKED